MTKQKDFPLDACHKGHLRVCACTLRMRGPSNVDSLKSQPLSNDCGQTFLWNGEIFAGLDVRPAECDTDVLYSNLTACHTDDEILATFRSVRGPYAFIYFSQVDQTLWFGRDCFGRRSLLWSVVVGEDGGQMFILSSVADQPDDVREIGWQEVPAKGIFRFGLKSSLNENSFDLTCFPWNPLLDFAGEIEDSICHSDSRSRVIKIDDSSYQFGHDTWKGQTLHVKLVKEGVLSENPVIPSLNRELPTAESMLPLIDAPCIEDEDSLTIAADCLLSHEAFAKHVDDFLDSLRQAVRRRLVGVDADSGIGILFSGGVDCSLLAAIVGECLPDDVPVDLLNVAFQPLKVERDANVKTKKINGKIKNETESQRTYDYDVPDRRTGLNAWRELKALNGSREWRFVAIDVPFEELTRWKKDRISKLIYPLRTILDDSIGCATWFAARGKGNLAENDGSLATESYESTARTLLLGSGADEQLGGLVNLYTCRPSTKTDSYH